MTLAISPGRGAAAPTPMQKAMAAADGERSWLSRRVIWAGPAAGQVVFLMVKALVWWRCVAAEDPWLVAPARGVRRAVCMERVWPDTAL